MEDESEILGYEENWDEDGQLEIDYDEEQKLLNDYENVNNDGEEEEAGDGEDFLELNGTEFEENESVHESEPKPNADTSETTNKQTAAATTTVSASPAHRVQQNYNNSINNNRCFRPRGSFTRYPRPVQNIRPFGNIPIGLRQPVRLPSKRMFVNPHYKGSVAVEINPTRQLGPCFLPFRQPPPPFYTPVNVPPPPLGPSLGPQSQIPSLMDICPEPPPFLRRPPPPPRLNCPPPNFFRPDPRGLLPGPNFARRPPPPRGLVPPFRPQQMQLPVKRTVENPVRKTVPIDVSSIKEVSTVEVVVKKIKLDEDRFKPPATTTTATIAITPTTSEKAVTATTGEGIAVDQEYLKKMEEQKRKREEILKMKELRRKEKMAAAGSGNEIVSSSDSQQNVDRVAQKPASTSQTSTSENKITVVSSNRNGPPLLPRGPSSAMANQNQPRARMPPPFGNKNPNPVRAVVTPVAAVPAIPAVHRPSAPQLINVMPPPIGRVQFEENRFGSDTVVIENLGVGSTEAQVLILCKDWGPILDLYLKPMERKAVVKFSSVPAAARFLQQHNGINVNGSILRINFL